MATRRLDRVGLADLLAIAATYYRRTIRRRTSRDTFHVAFVFAVGQAAGESSPLVDLVRGLTGARGLDR